MSPEASAKTIAAAAKAKREPRRRLTKKTPDTSHLTQAEKATMPSMHHFAQGHCKFEGNCYFSHVTPPPPPLQPTKAKAGAKGNGLPAKAPKGRARGAVAALSQDPVDIVAGGAALPTMPPSRDHDGDSRLVHSSIALATKGEGTPADKGGAVHVAALTARSRRAPPEACSGNIAVEWIDDTGAGRHLSSIKHIAKYFGVVLC